MTERQQLILKTIIETYQKKGEPVGSVQLLSELGINLSSSTLRMDMQWLEENNYLEKTHTSSGRIPSKSGYNYYIEHLLEPDDNSEYFPLIEQIINDNTKRSELAIKEAIKLISDLTSYTVIGTEDNLTNNYIAKIDYITTSDRSAVILIVTQENKVLTNSILFDEQYDSGEVGKAITTLNEILVNKTILDAKKLLESKNAVKDIFNLMKYQESITNCLIEAFSDFANDNLYAAGVSNSLGHPELNNPVTIRKLLEVLESRKMFKLIANEHETSVEVSNQIRVIPYNEYTLVTVPYGNATSHQGTIAVVGPNRMDYPKVISLLQYLAKMMNKI